MKYSESSAGTSTERVLTMNEDKLTKCEKESAYWKDEMDKTAVYFQYGTMKGAWDVVKDQFM